MALVFDHLSPKAQAFSPLAAPSRPPRRLVTTLQVIAVLLCVPLLWVIFMSESLAAYRHSIAILLSGSAILLALGAAQLARSNYQQEEIACASARHLLHAAEVAKIGLWGWKADGDQFWGTPTCLKMLGLEESAGTLKTFSAHLDPQDREGFCTLIRQMAGTREEAEYECRQPRHGRKSWLRFSISGAGENPEHEVSGSVMDVTTLHERDAEAANLRRSLTHLTRVGLLGQLSSALAHELKQPLTAILSNAQALQRLIEHKALDMDEIRAVIHDIVQDDTRAASVIEHLRSLLKPGEFNSVVLDLNSIVKDVLEIVHNEMMTRKVAISTALRETPLFVTGDMVQLQQLLLNLIFNAADATAGKGGMVLIATDLIEGPYAHLAVTDTGTGIDPHIAERLFEPFVSTKTQGVGLGLSISRAIVLTHKGRIWAENNPGRGATFHVTLPLAANTS